MGPPLPSDFYNRNPVEVARDLIGQLLVHDTPSGTIAGRIVETEAYAHDDPACHASKGMRPSNKDMFGDPGTFYVYRSYGVHWCANAVTGPNGQGEAVLLRAVEPILGLSLLKQNRPDVPGHRLCAGPGNLTKGFGITGTHSGSSLVTGSVRIHPGIQHELNIVCAPRIGLTVAQGRPWRFLVQGSRYVSKSARPAPVGAEW